ncbi:MAG: hypothetical protein ACE15E_21745 [Acidobacteriota bacterium]
MKYINHLNVIIAIIGVIVIAQTLTRTFWSSAPEKQFSVDVAPTRPRIQVQGVRTAVPAQKRSAVPRPGMVPGPAEDPTSSVAQPPTPGVTGGRNRLLTASPVQPSAGSAPAGATPGATAPPTVVTIPSAAATGLEGDTRGRSIRGQTPSGSRSTLRTPGADSRLNLPPPGGNDSAKRRPDPNAPAPPVRSSMPEQRVQ